jgi:hypothetical protein
MPSKKKNNSKQSAQYSGFVLTFEPERTGWLAEKLHSGQDLADSFSALDWKFERRELVLLVLSKEPFAISAIAMMERMHGSGGSGKLKMRISNIFTFDPPVQQTELWSDDLGDVVCTPETLSRTEHSTWESLLAEIREARPNAVTAIDRLIALRAEERRLLGESNRIERLNEQRDGVGLSLDIAELDKGKVLKSLKIEKLNTADSILDLLDGLPIHERTLLEHDAHIFQMLLGSAPAKSAMFSDGGKRSVRVHVVDQTPIETVLGIDLIIYSTCYDNFLLLQYKRMVKNGNNWCYNISPSSNINDQLERMRAFRSAASAVPPSPATLWSYRLHDGPFYFKFCEQFRPDARDDSLIKGITMPEPHLREFLTLPEAKGASGGLSIGYENCPRYLSNTEFIQLAKVGWIGAGPQSISLLKQVLHANREGGRSAMFAVIDTPKKKSASGRGKKIK